MVAKRLRWPHSNVTPTKIVPTKTIDVQFIPEQNYKLHTPHAMECINIFLFHSIDDRIDAIIKTINVCVTFAANI